jgi:hypothetical protein
VQRDTEIGWRRILQNTAVPVGFGAPTAIHRLFPTRTNSISSVTGPAISRSARGFTIAWARRCRGLRRRSRSTRCSTLARRLRRPRGQVRASAPPT